MSKFKPGDVVYAVKAEEDGTEATDHRFGFNSNMIEFAKGNVKGSVVEVLVLPDEIKVKTPTGTWAYGPSELRKTPRKVKKGANGLAKAPKKVYAVVKGERVFTAKTREDARERKAKLGGKAAGAIIVAYTPLQEIR